MGKTSPLDLVKPGTEWASRATAAARMQECHACPRLHALVCGECGCVMPIKTRLAVAECPLGKWGEEQGHE